MCFRSVRMLGQCDRVAGSVWGWSEQNMDTACWISAWQSQGTEGPWHVGCLRWRPETGAAVRGWEPQSVHCLLPLLGHRGKSWLGQHSWEGEFRRVTSEVSLLTRVKYHGISLGSAQTLFSHDQAGIGPIILLSVHGIQPSSDAGIVLSAIKQMLLHPDPTETHSLNSWRQDPKSHINSVLFSWQQ